MQIQSMSKSKNVSIPAELQEYKGFILVIREGSVDLVEPVEATWQNFTTVRSAKWHASVLRRVRESTRTHYNFATNGVSLVEVFNLVAGIKKPEQTATDAFLASQSAVH